MSKWLGVVYESEPHANVALWITELTYVVSPFIYTDE